MCYNCNNYYRGMYMENTVFSIRMDQKLKNDFNKMCEDFGLSMSTAFTLFAKAVVRDKKIPFTIMSSNSKSDVDFENARKNFYDIRENYQKNNGKELSLEEINSIIYGK